MNSVQETHRLGENPRCSDDGDDSTKTAKDTDGLAMSSSPKSRHGSQIAEPVHQEQNKQMYEEAMIQKMGFISIRMTRQCFFRLFSMQMF